MTEPEGKHLTTVTVPNWLGKKMRSWAEEQLEDFKEGEYKEVRTQASATEYSKLISQIDKCLAGEGDEKNESRPVRDALSFNHCPFCGEKTSRVTIQVGTYKTNDLMVCPNHGQLFLHG